MPDDLRRFDIPRTKAPTPGEDFTIDFTVREEQADGSFVNATSFASYSDWKFYVFDDLRDAGGTAAERGSAAIYSRTDGGNGIAEGTPPAVSVTSPGSLSAQVTPGERGYELWATAGAATKRVAYGTIPFVH